MSADGNRDRQGGKRIYTRILKRFGLVCGRVISLFYLTTCVLNSAFCFDGTVLILLFSIVDVVT